MGQIDFEYGYNDPKNKDYKTTDPPNYTGSCMGLMVCPHCGKAAMCGDVTLSAQTTTGENDDMINRDNRNNDRQGGRAGGRGGRRNGLAYLSTKEATHTAQPGKIIAARVEDDTFRPGNQVVAMRIRFKGQDWLYNLRTNNPTLDGLCNAFGDDESTWAGKDVSIFNEEDDFNGKVWLRIDPSEGAPMGEPEPVTASKGKRGK